MSPSPNRSSQKSVQAERRFRRIFLGHLLEEGYSTEEAQRFIFRTPRQFHEIPTDTSGLDLLNAFRAHYERQLAHSWYFEGLEPELESDSPFPGPPGKPVTFIVIPGIFGEFIDQLPFQSIVENEDSRFAREWRSALEEIEDEVYRVAALEHETQPLGDMVKIGSVDEGDNSLLNVVVMKALGGSLETLGSLESNVEILQRRLAKVFGVIDVDSDIYLVGYSRGLAVSLALVSALHEQDQRQQLSEGDQAWFKRLRGVVGLGGVFYGAQVAQDVLDGTAGATSALLEALTRTAEDLTTVPENASTKEKARIIAANGSVWSDFVNTVREVVKTEAHSGRHFLGHDLKAVLTQEAKLRMREFQLPAPNPLGIYSLVHGFLLETFRLKDFARRYNENVLALKQLVAVVVEGVRTLTPKARDEWWKTHELPAELRILSITGTMPDAFLGGFRSPLWDFDGFGARSSDFNTVLRSSYYDTLASENTLINDSQVSHYGSRYWDEMYPQHHLQHDYLGVLGTHHWGMAFPYMVEDDASGTGNAFPRATLLKSIATYITSLEEKTR